MSWGWEAILGVGYHKRLPPRRVPASPSTSHHHPASAQEKVISRDWKNISLVFSDCIINTWYLVPGIYTHN